MLKLSIAVKDCESGNWLADATIALWDLLRREPITLGIVKAVWKEEFDSVGVIFSEEVDGVQWFFDRHVPREFALETTLEASQYGKLLFDTIKRQRDKRSPAPQLVETQTDA